MIEVTSSLSEETSQNVALDDDDNDNDYWDVNPEEVGIKTCSACAAIKPLRAHHCSACGRCVLKMDHHCRKYPNSFILFSSYCSLDK